MFTFYDLPWKFYVGNSSKCEVKLLVKMKVECCLFYIKIWVVMLFQWMCITQEDNYVELSKCAKNWFSEGD